MAEINKAAIDLIKSFEGWRANAYKDAVGVWTIGHGHTDAAGSPKVTPGLKITKQEGEDILRADLKKYADAISSQVKVALNENQFGALVSWCYNVGPGNTGRSTLIRKLNEGDYSSVPTELAKWNKAGGKVLAGLTRRRKAEAELFQTPTTVAASKEDPILKIGSEGVFVTELQQNLNTLGYGPLDNDGKFGKATESAVRNFQKDAGNLEVDGWAGPRTLDAIGRALKDKELKPKLKEAEDSVPEKAVAEVKSQNTFAQILSGAGTGAVAAIGGVFTADYRTVIAIGVVGMIIAGVLYLSRNRLVAAFREINTKAKE